MKYFLLMLLYTSRLQAECKLPNPDEIGSAHFGPTTNGVVSSLNLVNNKMTIKNSQSIEIAVDLKSFERRNFYNHFGGIGYLHDLEQGDEVRLLEKDCGQLTSSVSKPALIVYSKKRWLSLAEAKTRFGICSTAESIDAEELANSVLIKDWRILYFVYLKLGKCDDGGPAEGYSEVIVKLLINSWRNLDKLSQLMKADRDFEQFVLRHIDETVGMKEINIIKSLAAKNCESSLRLTCDGILKTIQ